MRWQSRDGGMWHLASMISAAVKSGKDGAKDVLKLEAGMLGKGRMWRLRGSWNEGERGRAGKDGSCTLHSTIIETWA